jgi:hypothetical protein
MNYLVSNLATWTAYWAGGPEDAKDATDKSALEFIAEQGFDNVRTGSVVVTAAEFVTDRRALLGGAVIGETFNI